MQTNLIDYLIEKSTSHNEVYLEFSRYQLNGAIYYQGENFKKNNKKENPYLYFIKNHLEFVAIKILSVFRKKYINKKKIISSATAIWNEHISILDYDVYRPSWNLRKDFKIEANYKLFMLTKRIAFMLNNKDFNFLISEKFILIIRKYFILFKEECLSQNYRALFLPQDIGFFEKVAIKVFKELNKPSFFIAHGGMPNIYDGIHSNRTDYSIQWGQKQRDAFIKMGFNPSKLFVSGHSTYNCLPKKLRFDTSNILVLTKCINGISPLDKPHMEDKGRAIQYLYSLQHILQQLGIMRVILRPHPSESYNWYKKFIDNTFFVEDTKDIATSLNNASLVIGPISTTFIDAMYHEVNYITYEPLIDNQTLMERPVTPPMDGYDSRIPIAFSEEELIEIITKKRKIDLSVYGEFVKTPRDISFIKDIIG